MDYIDFVARLKKALAPLPVTDSHTLDPFSVASGVMATLVKRLLPAGHAPLHHAFVGTNNKQVIVSKILTEMIWHALVSALWVGREPVAIVTISGYARICVHFSLKSI